MLIIKNLKKVLNHSPSLIFGMSMSALILLLSYLFTDIDLIEWNLWKSFVIYEISIDIIIAILSGIFIAGSMYKIYYFSKPEVLKTGSWVFWSFIGILVSGCPACSITLASYLWLWAILSSLPFEWMELKILAFIILMISNYLILRDLELCQIKKQKK